MITTEKLCYCQDFLFYFEGNHHKRSLKPVSASSQHMNWLCLDELALSGNCVATGPFQDIMAIPWTYSTAIHRTASRQWWCFTGVFARPNKEIYLIPWNHVLMHTYTCWVWGRDSIVIKNYCWSYNLNFTIGQTAIKSFPEAAVPYVYYSILTNT